MRKYLFPQYTAHPEVANHFTFRTLRTVLPLAAIATVIAGLAILFLYHEYPAGYIKQLHVLTMLGLAALFLYLSARTLPALEDPDKLDHVAAVATSAIAFSMVIGTFTDNSFSPLPIALLVVSATTLYRSNYCFGGFAALAISADMTAQWLTGHALTPLHYFAAGLVPVFALLMRTSLFYMLKQETESRHALQLKVAELQTEKVLRNQTEVQFRQAQKLEGLGQLATGVAHDFNNYLYVISLMAEDMQIDDPDNEKLAIILSSTKGASGICDRMLSYAGRPSGANELYDVAALAREIKPVIRAAIPKSVSVQFDIHLTSLITQGDPTLVSQCLTNLVNNSFESIEDTNGTISVAIYKSERYRPPGPGWRLFGNSDLTDNTHPTLIDAPVVILEVSDTGQGMTNEVLERAFDPYFSTKQTPGHGFGLAITQGLVRGVGGHLLCKSKPGVGTTIRVVLANVEQTDVIRASEPVQRTTTRYNRLLLVDDEKSVRESAYDLLSKVGYDVTLAPSARVAISHIDEAEQPFDVIVSDYTMQDATGLELLYHLRESGDETPFILCSGYEPHSIKGIKEARPDAFLHKPFRLNQLEEVLVNINRSPQPLDD